MYSILHGLGYGNVIHKFKFIVPLNEVETYKYCYIPVFIFEHVFYDYNLYHVSWEMITRSVNSLTDTRQRHNTEYLKQIFPEKELRSLNPNFHIHVSVSDLIYSHDRSADSAAGKNVDRSWEYINRSQTHECGNWDWGRAIPFLGIYINRIFRCSVVCRGYIFYEYYLSTYMYFVLSTWHMEHIDCNWQPQPPVFHV